MSDIQDKLREALKQRAQNTPAEWGKLMDQAAEYIHNLKAENKRIRREVEGVAMRMEETQATFSDFHAWIELKKFAARLRAIVQKEE